MYNLTKEQKLNIIEQQRRSSTSILANLLLSEDSLDLSCRNAPTIPSLRSGAEILSVPFLLFPFSHFYLMLPFTSAFKGDDEKKKTVKRKQNTSRKGDMKEGEQKRENKNT